MDKVEAWVMRAILDKDKTGCVLDMLPLVLCKNCRHGKKLLFSDYISCQISDENESGCHASHKPEWFCADGEMKD